MAINITAFEKYAWFIPEPMNSAIYAWYNWPTLGDKDKDTSHVRRDLIETAIAIGAYVLATRFYPHSSLPIMGCLVSTISPNATRWGTGTYLFLTGLTGAWTAWGSGKTESVMRNIGRAVLGYLATTPTPTRLMNEISSLFTQERSTEKKS